MREPTPRPWTSTGTIDAGMMGEESILIEAEGHSVRIARMFTPNGPRGCNSLSPMLPETCTANADLIVKAVNHHDELVAALWNITAEIRNGPKHTGMTLVYLDAADAVLAKIGAPAIDNR